MVYRQLVSEHKMEFEEFEESLSKHSCQWKSLLGDLFITNIRIAFVCAGSETKSLTWANIDTVKYSPSNDPKGRAMIRIKSTLIGDDIVYQISAKTKEQAFAELEQVKLLVSQLKKSKPVVSTIASSLSTLNKDQKDLLASNPLLAKQYKILVQVNNVVNDQEFWQIHSDSLKDSNNASTLREMQNNKGQSNSLLGDLLVNKNGKVAVNLTVEKKQNIFSMYPQVRRAFEAEVPLRVSEVEFWNMYFRSEYFNAETRGAAEVGSRDDLMSRYAQEDDMSLVSIGCVGDSKRNRVGAAVDVEFDLTATFGDFRGRNSSTSSAIEQELGPSFSRLAGKYNKNGLLVVKTGVEENPGKRQRLATEATMAESLELTELLDSKEREVHAIQIGDKSAPRSGPSTTANESIEIEVSRTIESTVPDPSSAFVVSSSRVVKSMNPNDRLFGVRHAPVSLLAQLEPPESILASLSSAFPTPDRAFKLLQSETLSSIRVPVLRAKSILLEEDPHALGRSGGGLSSDPILLGDELLVGPVFEQVMSEIFADVTELLRHFYSLLNRTGDQAPAHGNQTAVKAEAIIRRLVDVSGKILESKKRKIAELQQNFWEQSEYDASAAVVSGLLELVQRASSRWTSFNRVMREFQ